MALDHACKQLAAAFGLLGPLCALSPRSCTLRLCTLRRKPPLLQRTRCWRTAAFLSWRRRWVTTSVGCMPAAVSIHVCLVKVTTRLAHVRVLSAWLMSSSVCKRAVRSQLAVCTHSAAHALMCSMRTAGGLSHCAPARVACLACLPSALPLGMARASCACHA